MTSRFAHLFVINNNIKEEDEEMAAIEMCRMNFGDSSSPHFISIRKKKSVGRMPMEMKRRTIYLIRQLRFALV